MTNRIGGPIPPEPPRGGRGSQGADGKKFQSEMRRVEEVEKVSETELDKKRKRALAKPQEEEGDLESAENRAPTPFESEFYLESNELPKPPLGFAELESNAIPTPENAPPPQVKMATPPSQPEVDENLPESEKFWEANELPDQPPSQTRMEEAPKEIEKKEGRPREKMKESPLLDTAKKWTPQAHAATHPKGKEKNARSEEKQIGEEKPLSSAPKGAIPKGAAKEPAPQKMKEAAPYQKREKKAQEKGAPIKAKEKEETLPAKASPMPFTPEAKKEKRTFKMGEKAPTASTSQPVPVPAITKSAAGEKMGKKDKERKKPEAETAISAKVPDPLPPSCIQTAQAAQISASPFVNPQTTALFIQMVGTIVYMAQAKPGISLTQVVLNSPNFKNSIFYNTTISIEKYATAPDSFNIRLTGTPEAVKLFSQNVDNFTSAFTAAYEDRHVTFRIGRIETEIATERPLIRRKKEGGGKDDLSRGKDEQ